MRSSASARDCQRSLKPVASSFANADARYEGTVAFTRNPTPAGTLLRWVCQNDAEYLNLTEDRLELTPAK